VRLGPDDFAAPPAKVTSFELPEPYAPRSSAFRRAVQERLQRVRVSESASGSGAPVVGEREAALAGAIEEHPVSSDPARDARVRAAANAERLDRDITRLERRVRSRSESLARQFDRVLRVLEAWGYVDEWNLTDAGELLARLYTETDLLVAESLRQGLLDGLEPAGLAAMVSCLTYERRGADGGTTATPARWPDREVARRARRLEQLWRELSLNEDDAGLPETRPPDPARAAVVHDWATGEDLADVLALDDEITGGDFVRHVKQCIDLLRQVAEVAPDTGTRAVAGTAAALCLRGVVAASSVLVP
jgi:ATP-dependent RNA helicase HelY